MQKVPPGDDVGGPQVVVEAGRLLAVAAVDEQERQRRRPGPRDERRAADHRDHRVLEAGVVDGLAEVRERVHLADGGVDEVGLVPLPPGLVLLGASVVVDGEQHPAELASRGAEVHRRLAAVGAHLEERAVDRHGRRRLVERQSLVRRHEAARGLRVAQELRVDHQVSWWMMRSRSRRGPGLKSVPPSGCATGMRAPCMTWSGMPSSSAVSFSFTRWSVV